MAESEKTGQDGTARLVTRSGLTLDVRPARPDDALLLAAFFEHVAREDLRFRFLTPLRHVNEAQIAAMTHVDPARGVHLLAFDAETGDCVGSAMMVGDDAGERAEVAISIHADHRGRGIGWTLLDHLAKLARARGYKRLQSVESRANHAAIALEREMGFSVRDVPGDPGSVIVEARLDGSED
jgi:acetyltransferase